VKNESNIINYKELLYYIDQKYIETLKNPKKQWTQKDDNLWMRLCNWAWQDEDEFKE